MYDTNTKFHLTFLFSGADRMGLNTAMGIIAVAALYRTLY